MGANFHKFSADTRALILFYWVFTYPSGTHTTNLPFIEAFLSILDTFHDFTGSRATGTFKNIVGTENTRNTLKKIDPAQLNLKDFNTQKAHKTLVKLLGTDIYRKLKKGYNTPLKTIISNANKRGLSADDKVGRMLYFITSMLGSDSGSLVQACEKLSQEILLHLADNDPIYERPKTFVFGEGRNKLCDLLDKKGACLVVDAINGSIPQCLAKHSVYHNVGVLDPATRSILSWSEVDGNQGCVDGAKEKLRQRKSRFKLRQRHRQIFREQTAKDRIKKAQETRARTKRKQATNKADNAAAKAAKTENQTLGRAARAMAAEKRKRNNNASTKNTKVQTPVVKRKRNNSASPTKNTKVQTPVVKRERNNSASPNNQLAKTAKFTSFKPPRGMTPSKSAIPATQKFPRPPRYRREALNTVPESESVKPQTRAASAASSRRNAPASAGTRSASRRTPLRAAGSAVSKSLRRGSVRTPK